MPGCVVREDCLEYALANGEKFGIWGGMSERERRRIRRARALARRANGASPPPESRPICGPGASRPAGVASTTSPIEARRSPPAGLDRS